MSEHTWEISCRELHGMLNSGTPPVVVDCREPEEHALCSIPGALLLPMRQWEEKRRELEPHRERAIVVYCHLGVRSQRVAEWLREQGFDTVQSLVGGIDAWAVEIEPEMTRY